MSILNIRNADVHKKVSELLVEKKDELDHPFYVQLYETLTTAGLVTPRVFMLKARDLLFQKKYMILYELILKSPLVIEDELAIDYVMSHVTAELNSEGYSSLSETNQEVLRHFFLVTKIKNNWMTSKTRAEHSFSWSSLKINLMEISMEIPHLRITPMGKNYWTTKTLLPFARDAYLPIADNYVVEYKNTTTYISATKITSPKEYHEIIIYSKSFDFRILYTKDYNPEGSKLDWLGMFKRRSGRKSSCELLAILNKASKNNIQLLAEQNAKKHWDLNNINIQAQRLLKTLDKFPYENLF